MGEPQDSTANELARTQRERDLYLHFLNLSRRSEIEPLLREALGLIVRLTNARQGYLELYEDDGGDQGERWSMAYDMSDEEVAKVRTMVSRGIIAEAIAGGQTVVTPSALLDPRFSERESVRLGRIEAVLCAPVGEAPPRGVLYLQGRPAPGLFTPEDRHWAETFARHLAPLAERLLAEKRRRHTSDPVAAYRKTLRLEGVVGRSLSLAATLRQVSLVAPLDVNVLLTGESGTGKSQLARAIHENGPRAAFPFVPLNCGALPETLVESELFGALPGAHSTAQRRIDGKVAAAEHGTLFLDEIGDLSLQAQGKLLQLLQSREYYPLGGAKAVQADVRVIAATNVDLQQAVAEKRFREDLLYRLQVLPIRVPSLAERRDDIAELAEFFCADASRRHRLARVELSRNALRALESAPWPGNVRQLAHCVEAATIRATAEGATQVETSHLFPDSSPAGPSDVGPLTFQEATRRCHYRVVRDALEATQWNIVETARRLDLTRSHVYNLIRSLGIRRAGE